jgi:hypothetical protein
MDGKSMKCLMELLCLIFFASVVEAEVVVDSPVSRERRVEAAVEAEVLLPLV